MDDLPALNPRQGENLAWRWGTYLDTIDDWEEEGWYDSERLNYNYWTGKSLNGLAIGEFTQMVWDVTSKLGCGTARTDETLSYGREWDG